MTKGELIQFLKPFSDELRLVIEDKEFPRLYHDIEPRYIVVDGEGLVLIDDWRVP